MSPTLSSATPKDELLKRYDQAKAMLPDGLPEAPSAATRERIIQTARNNATRFATISIAPRADSITAIGSKGLKNTPTSLDNAAPNETTHAANDRFWNIRAFASVGVMGLSALLWWQFENGTPQEQQAAKSAQPAAVSAPAPAAAKPTQPQPATPAPNITSRPNAKATTMGIAEGITPAVPAPKPLPQAEPPSQPSSVAVTIERSRTLQADPAQRAEAPVAAAMSAAPAPGAVPPAPRPFPAAAPMARSAPSSVAPQTDAALRQNYGAETAGQTAAAPNAASKAFQIPSAPASARSAAPTAEIILLPTEPLFAAIEQRNATALRQALSQGIFPNARSASGNPALTQAVSQRWTEGVRILLAAGADRSVKNLRGHTASDVALELGYADMAELLAAAK